MRMARATHEDLIHDHIAFAYDRQIHLDKQVGDWDWLVDEDEGSITFSKRRFLRKQRRSSPIQMLGSESHLSETWLWAWADPAQQTPEPLLVAAKALRTLGQEEDVAVLAEPQFELDAADGHTLAALAAGLTNAAGYYRCPYADGAAFILLTSPDFMEHVERPAMHVASRFPQILQVAPIADHRRAFIGYLERYGLAVTLRTRTVTAHDEETGDRVEAEFDDRARLSALSATTG